VLPINPRNGVIAGSNGKPAAAPRGPQHERRRRTP
jgi:hypothetical protein